MAPATSPLQDDGTSRPDPAAKPVLPVRSQDETDLGWGERPDFDDDRLLRDRPPHWQSN